MNIQSATFITSGTSPEHYPNDNRPEILFVGRSNVGKSSFINSILQRKNIAYTSSKPGKTQTLNFYLINQAFYFVDVPGYGYAKVSKQVRDEFAKMISIYLTTREQLHLVIQLVDFRHTPTKEDIQMHDFLQSYDIPTIVVGTKLDKVPKTKRKRYEKDILKTLQITQDEFLPYSSETKENLDIVYDIINQVLEE
ncbi:ribosome biogenesis GTP-binding protein YihA/YsxC [Candidatus Xianfuyuplasma coldseepsis]|uniref:Probable GTP-binding protein EngB n=1 Tax=Candidatus Xianfuyuplasma coldseepsis TaxID=2782163 RepID=A0A7L7KTM8_9MOLU|nr:ribosome biogenesis GTP-binding protein YihA/YsxC [Xianfuyuplasma coldseepsis]QMS85779.1 YihA family ribosome biogenesis GTP-binding protein [Xianfuyuplasma coldseepsis]